MAHRVFPPGADAILRRLYPDIAAIQAEIPGPTEAQIRNRARKAGIARLSVAAPFSDAEDAILDRLYPDVAACQEALPGRVKREIQRRAWHLKRARAGGPFSDEENATLARFYPDIDAIQAEMRWRSRRAIERQAAKLGLAHKIGKHQRYSAAQRRLIRIFYPDYDVLCAILAPRTREAIKAVAREMGLTRGKVGSSQGGHTRGWSDAEIAQLAECGAQIPGRTRSMICGARRRYGIKVDPSTVAAARNARNAARRSKDQSAAAERKAAAAARAEQRVRDNAAWAAEKLAQTARDRTAKVEARRIERMRAAQERRVERERAQVEARRQKQARALLPPAPIPSPTIPTPRRGADGIAPHVLTAAGRSPYGLDLVSTVQRAVPRDLWPHVKPRVIETLTMAVVEGRCDPDDLPALLPDAIKTVMAAQFEATSR